MEQKNKSVLIIEDNQDIRDSTAEILETANYITYKAENGKIGVEMAQANLPDIIVCDVMMPELDGFGVLYLLNKNPDTADIPFIFLTAKAERVDLRKGMERGADDYLIKPFDPVELLNAIETRLRKRDQLKKNFGTVASLDGMLNEAQSATLLTDLSEKSRIRTYKKKQSIYMDGDHASSVYLVKSGSIKTYMISKDGREIVTGMYKDGDFFGYELVLQNKPCIDNAEALELSELYIISREEFNSLLFKNTAIAKKFIELLSGNVFEKQDMLVKLAYDSVRKRLADALVSLAEKFGLAGNDVQTINVSRDDLAAMVGTANETVSRTLTDFKDEKLITKESSSIKILSVARLKGIRQ